MHSVLQIQMRDVGGFVDTRYRLLQLRSNNRNNWISFAIAHHLDGNHELCVQILSAYESTLVSNTELKLGRRSCSQDNSHSYQRQQKRSCKQAMLCGLPLALSVLLSQVAVHV
jgi:hypothetical protein